MPAGWERVQAWSATRLADPFETCSGCPVMTTGGIASRHVKGQRADDPQTEPANSPPPGLATTMRMAARPSSCLQRTPAAPFDLLASISICGRPRARIGRAGHCWITAHSRPYLRGNCPASPCQPTKQGLRANGSQLARSRMFLRVSNLRGKSKMSERRISVEQTASGRRSP